MKDAGSPTPRVLCVLGMHRSGTSAVSPVLSLPGVHLGPAERLTEYWEHQGLTDLNTEILAMFGGAWDDPPTLPDGWEVDPRLADLGRRARALIQEEFASWPLWGWKDPRTCLTLPFWRLLLPQTHYLICLRDPVDVAHSLERRDALPLAMGIRLWLTYVTGALQYTAAEPRLLVSERLMQSWPDELHCLGQFVGKGALVDREDVREQVRRFLAEELQHHRTSLADTLNDPLVGYPAKFLDLELGPDRTPGHEGEELGGRRPGRLRPAGEVGKERQVDEVRTSIQRAEGEQAEGEKKGAPAPVP